MKSFEDVPVITGENLSGAAGMIDAGHALQQVKTPYCTAVAVQKPRVFSKMVAVVLEEAEQAGSSFYYRWPVKSKEGKKEVIGGSIDMAASIFRGYQNCAMDIQCDERPSHYFFTATFIDLENGMSWPRMFRQRKSQNVGDRMDKDRAEDIVFQIGQSKAMRNAVLSVMPRWLVDRAIETARNAEIKRLSGKGNIELARAEVLRYFGKLGVTAEKINEKLGKPLAESTAEDLADLRSIATAIKDGMTSVKEAFPDPDPENAIKDHAETKGETPKHEEPPPKKTNPAPAPSDEPKHAEERSAETAPPAGQPETPKAGGPAPSNPFEDRDQWKNFKSSKDGLSTFYYKNRRVFGEASIEARKAFRDKWSACYPDVAFPGEITDDIPPPTPPDPGPGQIERQPGDESEYEGNPSNPRLDMIEAIKADFQPETIRKGKAAMGISIQDHNWPSTPEGCNRLYTQCRNLEQGR